VFVGNSMQRLAARHPRAEVVVGIFCPRVPSLLQPAVALLWEISPSSCESKALVAPDVSVATKFFYFVGAVLYSLPPSHLVACGSAVAANFEVACKLPLTRRIFRASSQDDDLGGLVTCIHVGVEQKPERTILALVEFGESH
jgi:hypothetical protein